MDVNGKMANTFVQNSVRSRKPFFPTTRPRAACRGHQPPSGPAPPAHQNRTAPAEALRAHLRQRPVAAAP